MNRPCYDSQLSRVEQRRLAVSGAGDDSVRSFASTSVHLLWLQSHTVPQLRRHHFSVRLPGEVPPKPWMLLRVESAAAGHCGVSPHPHPTSPRFVLVCGQTSCSPVSSRRVDSSAFGGARAPGILEKGAEAVNWEDLAILQMSLFDTVWA